MNVLCFTGNLGKDARTNTVGGQFVANFSVALTSGYGDKKQTIWVECAYWGKGAEAVAAYLIKGSKVAISGEIGHKDEKEYGWKITCRVHSVTLVGTKPESSAAPVQAAKAAAPQSDSVADDIPF
jgi:single-strand DNA-binding protein